MLATVVMEFIPKGGAVRMGVRMALPHTIEERERERENRGATGCCICFYSIVSVIVKLFL